MIEGNIWKQLTSIFVSGLGKNAFYRSLGFGIVFAIVMTLIIGGIEDVFLFPKEFPYFTVKSQSYWIGIIFVSFSLLFALLGYLSELNTRDDLLTPLRRELVGFWQVRAQTWTVDQGKIEFGWAISHCTIGIERLGGKLLVHFELSNSDIFKDQEFDITATAFSFDGAIRKLVYFYEAELELRKPIGVPPDQITKIEFPFLGVLKIEFENEKVNSMSGHWYDINNGIYHLARRMAPVSGLAELQKAVENGAVTFGGDLEFKRLKALPGMAPARD
jgi:hypothetical protein